MLPHSETLSMSASPCHNLPLCISAQDKKTRCLHVRTELHRTEVLSALAMPGETDVNKKNTHLIIATSAQALQRPHGVSAPWHALCLLHGRRGWLHPGWLHRTHLRCVQFAFLEPPHTGKS
jgi:hypothetical protein